MTTLSLTEQQRLELLYRVSREISDRLDLNELLARVLRETAASAQADAASLLIVNENLAVVSSALIADGVLHSDPQRELEGVLRDGLAGWVLTHRQPVLMPDTSLDPRWSRRPDDARMGAKSAIAVPLLGRTRVVGVLTLARRPAGSFVEDDLTLLTVIGDHAAVAIENAALYSESQRRADAMAALAETARAVNSTLELDQVLRLVVDHARALLRVETAGIALVDADGLMFREASGRRQDELRGLRLQVGEGLAGWVAAHNQAVISPNRPTDARFVGGLLQRLGLRVRASAGVPIVLDPMTDAASVIGVIEVINPFEDRFGGDTLPLLDSLAALAATAITHARQMAELQAAESRFSGLFEDNIDPILITDLDGVITDANRKAVQMFGYEQRALIGLRITTVHRTGTAFLGSDRYAQLRDGSEIMYQTRVTTRAGDEIPMEVHAKLIVRRGQSFIQWIQRDISERLQLEEMRADLISMIFHDLRSPLGNVITSLETVSSGLPTDRVMEHSLLTIAQRSAGRMSRLVDSLLDLRRLEAGQMVLQRDVTDLRELVDEVRELTLPMATVKHTTLSAEVLDGLPLIAVDSDMIRRVLINLVENAIKYTPVRGRVTISVTVEPAGVILHVTDTGPGIPPSDQSRVFGMFTRLQRDRGAKGLGLGLAFCRLAVQAHGGRIWVESEPGAGSTFHVALPREPIDAD